MKSGADRRAGAAHDLDREPAPLLRRAAPRVGALVGARREELVEQIAFAAHDLDAVVAGLAGQLRAAGEVVDGAVDAARRQPARPERVDRRLDRRRADRKRVVGIASRVQDLQQDLAARVVHGGGDAAVPAGLRRGHHLRGERQQPAGAVGRVAAGDDQADAAAGAFGEVLGEPVGVAGAVLQAGVHRAHDHPVAQRGEAKIQRRQQIRVWRRSRCPSQRAEHFVEPVDRALLGADAAAQHQVLVQCAAAQRGRVGELALLESPVGVQQLGALGAQRIDLRAQRVEVAVCGAADLDRQFAGAGVGRPSCRGPTAVRRSSGPARRGRRRSRCRPSCPACPAARPVSTCTQPSSSMPQRAVDLLVGGGPEVADRAVEPAGQLVAGAGLLAQRHQDRVGECHCGSLGDTAVLCN